jgi:hypothetical protein
MEHFDILNMILADKAADYEDFRNILVSSDIDEKRIKSLAKRQKIEKLKFLNFDEMENAGDIAAFFTNMEEDQTLICRYSEYQSEQIKELIEGMLRSRSFELILGSDEDPQIKTIFCGGFSIIMLKEKYLTIPSDTLSLFHLKILIDDAEIEVQEIEFEENDEDTSSDSGETAESQFKYVPKNKKAFYEIQGLEKDGTFLYVETCYRSGEILLASELSEEEMDDEEIIFNDFEDASYFDVIETEYDFDGDDEELEKIKTAWQDDGLSGLENIGWFPLTLTIKIIGGISAITSGNIPTTSQTYSEVEVTESTKALFYSIEDKILENGSLVSVTSDNEASISIKLAEIDDSGSEGTYLTILIKSEQESIDDNELETLCDYVFDKAGDLASSSNELKELLDKVKGIAVFVRDELHGFFNLRE